MVLLKPNRQSPKHILLVGGNRDDEMKKLGTLSWVRLIRQHPFHKYMHESCGICSEKFHFLKWEGHVNPVFYILGFWKCGIAFRNMGQLKECLYFIGNSLLMFYRVPANNLSDQYIITGEYKSIWVSSFLPDVRREWQLQWLLSVEQQCYGYL